MRRSYGRAGRLACALVCGAACGDDGGGSMNPPQESVSDGNTTLSGSVEWAIAPGNGVAGLASEALADGWAVRYDKFLVTVGSIGFTAADGSRVISQVDGVVDLLNTAGAMQLATVEVPSGTSQVRFSMPGATARFVDVAPLAQADLDLMREGGYSLYVEGAITRPDGHTCTGTSPRVCTPAPSVRFRWGVAIDVVFEDCATVELAGDATVEQTVTLAGDRWFRGDFTGDTDTTPTLRAQWIADADADRDGEATLAELEQLAATGVFTRALGYNVRANAPIPVVTARDFFEAQARATARDALGGRCKVAPPQ